MHIRNKFIKDSWLSIETVFNFRLYDLTIDLIQRYRHMNRLSSRPFL